MSVFIHRCDRVLKPKGIDIKKILTEKDSKIFDNIINGFLGIGAIQIGLIELLKELGIVPDFIIGKNTFNNISSILGDFNTTIIRSCFFFILALQNECTVPDD